MCINLVLICNNNNNARVQIEFICTEPVYSIEKKPLAECNFITTQMKIVSLSLNSIKSMLK